MSEISPANSACNMSSRAACANRRRACASPPSYLALASFIAGRDAEAVDWAQKTIQANPKFPGGPRSLAASHANLGQIPEAAAARQKLQELLPHVSIAQLRDHLPFFKQAADLERYLEGLRKAGLPEGDTD